MAQGKAYTPEERAQIIESLQSHLEMGLSRNSACYSIGFDPTTLSKWVQEDAGLSIKLQSWEAYLGNKAVANIHKAIDKESELDDTRKENSWRYAERKVPEFKPKSEQDVTSEGKAIQGFNFVRADE